MEAGKWGSLDENSQLKLQKQTATKNHGSPYLSQHPNHIRPKNSSLNPKILRKSHNNEGKAKIASQIHLTILYGVETATKLAHLQWQPQNRQLLPDESENGSWGSR